MTRKTRAGGVARANVAPAITLGVALARIRPTRVDASGSTQIRSTERSGVYDVASEPFPKEKQLARGTRRYHRKVASAKTWQAIIDAKRGPCRVCDLPATVGAVDFHHLVPRAIGGSDVEDNIVPLCRACHGLVTRGDRDACTVLRMSFTDAEHAYVHEVLGEARVEARYPARWSKP